MEYEATSLDQRWSTKATVEHLNAMAEAGWRLVTTYGNKALWERIKVHA